jgi:hypothetical protein
MLPNRKEESVMEVDTGVKRGKNKTKPNKKPIGNCAYS